MRRKIVEYEAKDGAGKTEGVLLLQVAFMTWMIAEWV